jgi:hypothetical protein
MGYLPYLAIQALCWRHCQVYSVHLLASGLGPRKTISIEMAFRFVSADMPCQWPTSPPHK